MTLFNNQHCSISDTSLNDTAQKTTLFNKRHCSIPDIVPTQCAKFVESAPKFILLKGNALLKVGFRLVHQLNKGNRMKNKSALPKQKIMHFCFEVFFEDLWSAVQNSSLDSYLAWKIYGSDIRFTPLYFFLGLGAHLQDTLSKHQFVFAHLE